MRRIALISTALLFAACTQSHPPYDPPALKWSNPAVAKTPSGLGYHGPFSNDTIAITQDLDLHDVVWIDADLLIFKSWDGSVPTQPTSEPSATGPDFISLAVKDGPTLLYTTFSNLGDPAFTDETSKFQNYPSQVPGDRLPAMTGATEQNKLGIVFHRQSEDKDYPMDARYHVHFKIPHQGKQITLEFSAVNLQEPEDEDWGIANVKVQGYVTPAMSIDGRAVEADLAQSFELCANVTPENADHAAEAFNRFFDFPYVTIPWLEKNVAPKPVSVAAFKEQLAVLAGGNYEKALAAQQRLFDLGPQIEPLLRDAAKTARSDGLARIDWLLQVISTTPITDREVRRVVLATRILEIINSPEALALRQKLVAQ